MSEAEQRPPAGKGHPMTWTPPPESERPHRYLCLALIEAYWGATASGDAFGRAIWITCEWDADEKLWVTPLKGVSIDNILKFAPSPRVFSARIAELEAEIVDQKRMRQEEKDKILRQRAEIVSLMKENRRHLSMARGLQKRVAALETAEADIARLREFVRVWEENLGKLLSDAPLPGPAFHPPIPVRNCPRCSLPWDRAVGYVCTDPYCPRGGPAYATGDAR